MFSIIYMNHSYTLVGFTLTASLHDKRHITRNQCLFHGMCLFFSEFFLLVVHLRSSVSEKAPGKSLALQLIQIKLRCDHALAVAVHGPDHFAGTVRDEGGAIKFQG